MFCRYSLEVERRSIGSLSAKVHGRAAVFPLDPPRLLRLRRSSLLGLVRPRTRLQPIQPRLQP